MNYFGSCGHRCALSFSLGCIETLKTTVWSERGVGDICWEVQGRAGPEWQRLEFFSHSELKETSTGPHRLVINNSSPSIMTFLSSFRLTPHKSPRSLGSDQIYGTCGRWCLETAASHHRDLHARKRAADYSRACVTIYALDAHRRKKKRGFVLSASLRIFLLSPSPSLSENSSGS